MTADDLIIAIRGCPNCRPYVGCGLDALCDQHRAQFDAVLPGRCGDSECTACGDERSDELAVGAPGEWVEMMNTKADAQWGVADLNLPEGIHVQVISTRHVGTGAIVYTTVIWGDRAHSCCLRCGQSIDVVVTCPVTLDSTGQVRSLSLQHVCGVWNGVVEQTYSGIPGAATIEEAARQMYVRRQELIAERVAAIESELARQFAEALVRLGEPLAEGETIEARRAEVTTGSETHPGLYWEAGTLTAWAYHPVDETQTIGFDMTDLKARLDNCQSTD